MPSPKPEITLTVSAAATAAGLDRKTVAKRLADSRETPDAEGRYSLRQIVSALTTGVAGSRARLLAAQAAIAEFELARLNAKYLDSEVVTVVWRGICDDLKTCILNLQNLSTHEKHLLCSTLRAVQVREYVETPATPAPDDDDAPDA